MRSIVEALCEGVKSGVLFVNGGGGESFLGKVPGIYTPNTKLVKACEDFVKQWSYVLPSNVKNLVRHDPIKVVDMMIENHDLVVLVRLTKTVSEAIPGVPEDDEDDDYQVGPLNPTVTISGEGKKPDVYQAENVDGILAHQDVVNLIRDGTIKPGTMLKVVGERWKPASSFEEFENTFSSTVSVPGGGIVTPSAELAKQLAPDKDGIRLAGRYKYYSKTQHPNFALRQRHYIQELMEVDTDDILYWYRKFVDPQPSGQTLGDEFLGKGKGGKGA